MELYVFNTSDNSTTEIIYDPKSDSNLFIADVMVTSSECAVPSSHLSVPGGRGALSGFFSSKLSLTVSNSLHHCADCNDFRGKMRFKALNKVDMSLFQSAFVFLNLVFLSY